MLEEQNEFLLRDLKSVEESYGTDAFDAYGVRADTSSDS